MGVTAIKRVENRSGASVALVNIENPSAPGSGRQVAPGRSAPVDMWIPWAGRSDFASKHLRLRVSGTARFWIWQAMNADGDHVRFSTDGRWRDRGERVDGISAVDGDRTLVVFDNGFQLVDFPQELLDVLSGLVPSSRYRLAPSNQQRPVESVAKTSAVAFSFAGPASDQRVPIYRDSGKRYAFELRDGVVTVTAPDGGRTALTTAVSYARRRTGEAIGVPRFDLLAASGGRVFAKAQGDDRFFFTTLDEMFVHRTPRGAMTVPSTYFKLDPEYLQPDAVASALTKPLAESFANHPAGERFPAIRKLLELGLTDMMVVRIVPKKWHELDARPPLGTLNLSLALLETALWWIRRLLSLGLPAGPLDPLVDQVGRELRRLLASATATGDAPPEDVPTYPAAVYRDDGGSELVMRAIDYQRVLDIGVGHVHHHEQYESVTGGELQPVRDSGLSATLFRLLNGPVRDGDGYIDGTCNFYTLVELRNPEPGTQRYALLFQDEQSYFTQRWRLVHPDDATGLAVAADLSNDVFAWNPATYWCPFRAGHIGAKSRLAVAAQVVLVTGDAERAETRSHIYSINFSWSTMDRTWRWRELPSGAEIRYFDEAAVVAGTEPVVPGPRDGVYPQTIRLREDMTLHVKGSRAPAGGQPPVVGRWYQRYLPASNQLVPPASELLADRMPADPYEHAWRFISEPLFALADRFSHFGVYDIVDSRTQYYDVEPVSRADEDALAAAGGGPWVDTTYALTRWAPKLSYAAPMHLLIRTNLVPGVLERRPPSLFNPDTRLRIVHRRGRWIAMHADKRDDDLLEFDGLGGREIVLTAGARRARVRLRAHHWVDAPPAVALAEFRWSGEPDSPAAIRLFPSGSGAPADLWRVRLAALESGLPGRALHLATGELSELGDAMGGAARWEYRWIPSAADADALRRACVDGGPAEHGTSIWLEDIVGHVSTPEDVRWLKTSPMRLVVDRPVTVREADTEVDSGIDVEPEDDVAFDAEGSIWAGVALTGPNGPAGWDRVDHDPKFPLHEGPDARPFSLIARYGDAPWFYVGAQRGRAVYNDAPARLRMRTNDDAPGNGNGEFTCRVRVWRELKNPFGALDEVSRTGSSVRVRGWAIDPNTVAPIDVHVYVDGAMAGGFTANGPRPDVGAAHPGFGNAHGYDVTLPVGNGRHRVCVYAINFGQGTVNPELGCRTIVIEPEGCAALRGHIASLNGQIAQLQAELAGAVGAEKARILAEIRAVRAEQLRLRGEADALGCA